MTVRSVPKPSRTPRKAKKPPRARNPKRSAAEFERTYLSAARVLFVKQLPCCQCGASPCENAHTTGGGMGRKGHYSTIAPLCARCHSAYDEHRAPFDQPMVRAKVADAAGDTQSAWFAEHHT